MPREAELSNIERDFILQALRKNIRLDGRQLEAYRDLDITFGEEYGTVDIRLGKTRSVLLIIGNRGPSNIL
jgi:exosome complex component RRP45